MKSSKKIFIYGVPGTGKTHFSKILGKRLDRAVFEGDAIKKKVRKGLFKNKFPFLFLGTCQAFKEFGSLTQENAEKGLFAVRKALRSAVIDEIGEIGKHNNDFILEGAFLDPKILKKLGKVILITTLDEKKHRKHFFQHREKLLDLKREEFKAARMNQQYLVDEANSLGIQIIDSGNDLGGFISDIA